MFVSPIPNVQIPDYGVYLHYKVVVPVMVCDVVCLYCPDSVPGCLRKTQPLSMDTHDAVMTTESLPWYQSMTVLGIIRADIMPCYDWLEAVMRFPGAGHDAVSMFPCVSNSRDGQSVQPHRKCTQTLQTSTTQRKLNGFQLV